MKKYLAILTGLMLMMSLSQASAQEWVVPEEQKAMKNPYPINNENVRTGKDLYMINCKSCHGDPGKNNHLPLVPPPPDVTSAQMQANNDGMVHYKITTGRLAMPAFEKTLAEEQRWKIVTFIKSFDPANAGLLVREEPLKARLTASADTAKGLLHVSAQYQDKQGAWVPLEGADFFVSTKRTFGSLPIGQAKTNGMGYGEFAFPKSYVGDEQGLVNLELSLGEDYAANVVSLNQVKIGTPAKPEDLFKNRILWSTNDRTQWWLILSYVGVVAGVWATIFYVMFQIVKIYRAGKG